MPWIVRVSSYLDAIEFPGLLPEEEHSYGKAAAAEEAEEPDVLVHLLGVVAHHARGAAVPVACFNNHLRV